MGRIKTTFVKATGVKIHQKHKDKFTEDFMNNKKRLDEVAQINSKKLRNVMAGYITKLIKKDNRNK